MAATQDNRFPLRIGSALISDEDPSARQVRATELSVLRETLDGVVDKVQELDMRVGGLEGLEAIDRPPANKDSEMSSSAEKLLREQATRSAAQTARPANVNGESDAAATPSLSAIPAAFVVMPLSPEQATWLGQVSASVHVGSNPSAPVSSAAAGGTEKGGVGARRTRR